MELKNYMINIENQNEFDFNLLKGNNEYATICGLKVKIDRIIRDITQTTVIGVSGTFVVRGVKVRSTWDAFGNIMEATKCRNYLSPSYYKLDVSDIFKDVNPAMLQLVNIKELEQVQQPQQGGYQQSKPQ